MLTPGLALSAVSSLLRFREKLDTILSLREASANLPFALPDAPKDTAAHLKLMFAFFDTAEGQLILELHDLVDDYEKVKARPGDPTNQGARRRVFQLFYESSDTLPVLLGPKKTPNVRADKGVRLSYYIVSSAQLSKNSATARILLATADTILDFVGQNASTLISNPKTAAIVGTVLDEFAIQRDFDDDGAEDIFKSLLGSVLIAVTEHGDDLPEEPLVGALVGALADVRKKLGPDGDDFVAKIISKKGFETMLGSLVSHVAEDPELLPNDPRLRAVLSATLEDVQSQIPALLEDPTALLGVLEVTVTTAAGAVESLLGRKLGNRPLIPQVLIAVSKKVEELGKGNALFRSVASGDVLSEVFRTTLTTIGQNPDILAKAAKVDGLVATMLTQVADLLGQKEVGKVFTVESLRTITSSALGVLAANPDALGVNHEFASRVVVSVIKAASSAVADGLSIDDLEDLIDAALKAATGNVRLLELDDRLLAVLGAAGGALADEGVRALLTVEKRKDALLETMAVVATNPVMWSRFDKKGLAQPIVQAVIRGLADDPSKLLSGDVLVEAMRGVLKAVARRGGHLIDENVDAALLEKLLVMALESAEKQIGIAIDGENLPTFLVRITSGFLRKPFALTKVDSPEFSELVSMVSDELEPFVLERLES